MIFNDITNTIAWLQNPLHERHAIHLR